MSVLEVSLNSTATLESATGSSVLLALCVQVMLVTGGIPMYVQDMEMTPVPTGTNTTSSLTASTSGSDGEREEKVYIILETHKDLDI